MTNEEIKAKLEQEEKQSSWFNRMFRRKSRIYFLNEYPLHFKPGAFKLYTELNGITFHPSLFWRIAFCIIALLFIPVFYGIHKESEFVSYFLIPLFLMAMYHWINIAFNKRFNFDVSISHDGIFINNDKYQWEDINDILIVVRPPYDKIPKDFLILIKNERLIRYEITYLNPIKICAAILFHKQSINKQST